MRNPGLALLLALLVPGLASAQARPKVVAVKSAALAPYASVVAGFRAEADADVQEVMLDESSSTAARIFKTLALQKPALVLAIGPLAANAARRSLGEDIPVLFVMVPYFEKYGLEGPNVTGIALTSDYTPELGALKAISPKVKRVGMLHDPRFSAKQVQTAQEAASAVGLSIVPLAVESQARVEKVLGSVRFSQVVRDRDRHQIPLPERTLRSSTVSARTRLTWRPISCRRTGRCRSVRVIAPMIATSRIMPAIWNR